MLPVVLHTLVLWVICPFPAVTGSRCLHEKSSYVFAQFTKDNALQNIYFSFQH